MSSEVAPKVQVLGRVRLEDDDADRTLGSGQARELLALLVCRRGHPVTTAQIVDTMWPDDPPATVTTIVHGLVRRIRQALGPTALVRDDDGYRLQLDPDDVDLWIVDRALADGDDATAVRLWHDPAFGRYATRPWALEAVEDIRARLRPELDDSGLLRMRRRVPVSRLVGRRRELNAVVAASRRSRLVSIVGLGGVGKTRLALEAARHLDVAAVLHVDVAAAPGPAASRVAAELGQATDARTDADLRAAASLIGRSRQLLLVDGCEHDITGMAGVIEFLLGQCPELHVIATSRTTLGVPGEHVVPLLPFADPENLRGDAVALLLDRAQGMGLVPTPADRARAAEICRACAGVPLAIELSASQLVFGVTAATGEASGPEATVTRVVDAAIAALSAPTASLARRAAGLVAGFTPDFAAAVLDGGATVGALHELVSSGLVVAETSGTSRRLRFLDEVRDALCQRANDDDRRRMRATVHALFDRVRTELSGPVSTAALSHALGELTNGEALLAGLVDGGARTEALRLATAMADTWAEDGQWSHGSTWLTSLLDDAGGDVDPLEAAAAVRALGAVSGTYAGSLQLAERFAPAAAVAHQAGDHALEAHLLLHLTNASGYAGHIDEAAEHAVRMARAAQRSGSDYLQVGVKSLQGMLDLVRGEPAAARDLLVHGADRMATLGATSDAARLRRLASIACRHGGDPEAALEQLELGARLAAEAHARGTLATIRTDIADLRVRLGLPGATGALVDALAAVLAVGNLRAAGLIRTRLGEGDRDPATIAQGVLDLWHSDRRWAGVSLVTLLEVLGEHHPLRRLGSSVAAALVQQWGAPLDAEERDRVGGHVDGVEPADSDALDELYEHLVTLAADRRA